MVGPGGWDVLLRLQAQFRAFCNGGGLEGCWGKELLYRTACAADYSAVAPAGAQCRGVGEAPSAGHQAALQPLRLDLSARQVAAVRIE